MVLKNQLLHQLMQKHETAKNKNIITEKKRNCLSQNFDEKRVWFLYLGRSAAFLEQEKEQLYFLIKDFMEKEGTKRNLDIGTKKILFGYAIEEIEMRILEYGATFMAYQKSSSRLEKYLKLQENIKIYAEPLYDGDVDKEYQQILSNIKKQEEEGKQEEAIIEFLFRKYKIFPCNCLLHEPKRINYLPGYVAAKAIAKAMENFYFAIDSIDKEQNKKVCNRKIHIIGLTYFTINQKIE